MLQKGTEGLTFDLMLPRYLKRKLLKGLSGLVTLSFLVLYAVGSLQVESFHRLIHGHDEATLHSAEQEENNCHRVVYHNEAKSDCDHKSHITENRNCPLCQISVQQFHLPGDLTNPLVSFSNTQPADFREAAILTIGLRQSGARAPPHLS